MIGLRYISSTIGQTLRGSRSRAASIANSGHNTTATIITTGRTMAYVSNKRITRIPADTEVDKSELKSEGNEAYVDVRLTNRNPRNLEQLLLAPKPMGFELDSPNRHYWNKVVFEKKSKYLVGKIVHHSGRTLVSVASNEAPISAKLTRYILEF